MNFSIYMPLANKCSLFLSPASENEIKHIIANLNYGATGEHGVTAKTLKIVSDAVITPNTHQPSGKSVISTERIIPQDLKTALICPIYKAKDPMIVSNNCPISPLSIFSEISFSIWLPKYSFNFHGSDHLTRIYAVLWTEELCSLNIS